MLIKIICYFWFIVYMINRQIELLFYRWEHVLKIKTMQEYNLTRFVEESKEWKQDFKSALLEFDDGIKIGNRFYSGLIAPCEYPHEETEQADINLFYKDTIETISIYDEKVRYKRLICEVKTMYSVSGNLYKVMDQQIIVKGAYYRNKLISSRDIIIYRGKIDYRLAKIDWNSIFDQYDHAVIKRSLK